MTRSLMPPIDTVLTRHRLKLREVPVAGIDVHCLHHLCSCVHAQYDTAGNITWQDADTVKVLRILVCVRDAT